MKKNIKDLNELSYILGLKNIKEFFVNLKFLTKDFDALLTIK